MKTYLSIPVNVIPQWTKDNVPTYPLALFSNDGRYVLIDNAHKDSAYKAWLGPHYSELQEIINASTEFTHDEVLTMKNDPNSRWYVGE